MNTYQYPQHQEYANPLIASIEAAEEQLKALDEAARRLERAIADALIAKSAAQDAKELLAAYEAEYVVEWTAQAEEGNGPLAGIAKTSKAFSYALDNALTNVRSGILNNHVALADKAAVAAMNADIILQQSQVQFRTCMAAAELRTAILSGRTKSAY